MEVDTEVMSALHRFFLIGCDDLKKLFNLTAQLTLCTINLTSLLNCHKK